MFPRVNAGSTLRVCVPPSERWFNTRATQTGAGQKQKLQEAILAQEGSDIIGESWGLCEGGEERSGQQPPLKKNKTTTPRLTSVVTVTHRDSAHS